MNDKIRQKWFEAFTHHKTGKVVALLLAVVVWYTIQPVISFEATISDVPVRVQLDAGCAVLEQSSNAVDVLFRGSREGIRDLRQEQLEVVADARGLTHGESMSVPLELRGGTAPPGVRPVYIHPSEVMLRVDQEADREIAVIADIQGEPPEGYEIERVSVTPSQVTVRGPRQRLKAIEEIRTVPIDMEDRLQSFRLRVGLIPPGRTWTARMEPDFVQVEVTLTGEEE